MVARNAPREIKIPCQQNLLCKHEASIVEGATDLSLGLNHYRFSNHELQEYFRCDSRSFRFHSDFLLEFKIKLTNKE